VVSGALKRKADTVRSRLVMTRNAPTGTILDVLKCQSSVRILLMIDRTAVVTVKNNPVYSKRDLLVSSVCCS
jgi:hypothetical protein